MMKCLNLDDIKPLIDRKQLVRAIEDGFVLFSKGKVNVPPVGFLHFDAPPGDVHIKYGSVIGDDRFVLKVASGFYENEALGLPVSNGLMMLFSQETGALKLTLLDECWLTDMRTAAAGAVAAKYLAPDRVGTIGIVGTGVQARLQLKLLRDVVDCQHCLVWGRDPEKARRMVAELQASDTIRDWGLDLEVSDELGKLAAQCNLIVTTTPSPEPLLFAEQVRPGTHITAMGSDDHGKQELDARLLAKADLVVADSIAQCIDHGECAAAIREKQIELPAIRELGDVIMNPDLGRTDEAQISIADLTGVAIQDIQIAKMVENALRACEQQGEIT